MAKANKEKRRDYYAKVKDQEGFKQKVRKRKRVAREKRRLNMTSAQIKWFKVKETERVLMWRQAKKERANTSGINLIETTNVTMGQLTDTLYTPQSLGKALKCAQKSLPKSQRKRKQLVLVIAKAEGLIINNPTPKPISKRALSDEIKETVILFYCSDDVSYQMPGKKDCIVIRKTCEEGLKTKSHVQARYMLVSLSEAHGLFLQIHASVLIGKSKFCELRPPHVKLNDKIPDNVCVCIYHENVCLLLSVLQVHSQLSASFSDFLAQITCDQTDKKCMDCECVLCKHKLDEYVPERIDLVVNYIQWTLSGKIYEKAKIISTLGAVFSKLKDMVKQFCVHTCKKETGFGNKQNKA